MPNYSLKINNKTFQVDVEEDTPVLWVLRDHLQMVGTKFGCGMAMCGACTVLIDDNAARSCSVNVGSIGDQSITTIEGLSEDGDHPLQQAWQEVDVPQCGYCQAGQIMNAAALLKRNPNPSDAEIESVMNGNICRCGTYIRIKQAIKSAVEKSSIS